MSRAITELEGDGIDTAKLIAIWRSRAAAPDGWPVQLYCRLGEKVLEQGEPLLAYDVVRQGLHDFPQDVRLRQLQGLALARSGATERASEVLEQLVEEDHADAETLGMLARTWKDRAIRAGSQREARRCWRNAADTYAQAYSGSGDYWTGINAATTALLLGEKERAFALTKKVRATCLRQLRRIARDDYWLLATLGEAALIDRAWSEAREWYARAARLARRRFGDLQASRRNARLLLDYWQADRAEVESLLWVPPVAIFAGHMVDRPDRAVSRFPEREERAVAKLMRERIAKIGAAIGYASAACGSDILFLEAMLAAGSEIIVVLPCPEKEFLAGSVISGTPARWPERFARVMEKAARVIVASTEALTTAGVWYDYTNQLILGLARIRARQLETDVVPLAVWDRGQEDGPGGTASAIRRWEKLVLPIEMIELASLIHSPERTPQSKPRPVRLTNRKRRAASAPQIRAMLFADAVGFSRLTELELPRFVRHFLGAISRLIHRAGREVVMRNTWGDGLFLVFRDVRAAGNFALDLAGVVTRRNWPARGLPAGLSLRIGVHAGPVYGCMDPIKHARDFFGAHVSRTARIEPITPPGQVYASEAFAALVVAQEVTDFSFEYAGQVPMAKGYGIYPMYHVTRGSRRRAKSALARKR